MYGHNSEQLSPDQLRMLLVPLEADDQLRQEAPPAPTVAAREKPVREGGGRRKAPEHLPIERIEIDLLQAEKGGLVRICEEITEEFDYQPGQFIRRYYVRFVYADRKKQTAPKMPSLPRGSSRRRALAWNCWCTCSSATTPTTFRYIAWSRSLRVLGSICPGRN